MVFWWRDNRLSLEQECELLKSLGYGVELWPNTGGLTECRYDRQNWPRLKAATEGMLVSMRSRNDNPTIEQWAEQIECAKLLGANIVADLQSLRIPEGPDVNGWDKVAEILKLAADNDIRICLETGPLPILKQVGEKFDSLLFCLDTCYANRDDSFTFKDYVDGLIDRVVHLHLSENYGKIDHNEPLGCCHGIGREDWDYLLDVMNTSDNEVVAVLEMSPCTPLVMIRQASNFLFNVLKWPDPPHKLIAHDKVGISEK